MIILINAGGSGTRLWPLSQKSLPKQFLKIADGGSLLQETYARALKIVDKSKIYVSTAETFKKITLKQLSGLDPDNVITEPARRDTMACVLNATQYISSRHDEQEIIASISSDHYIAQDQVDKFCLDLKLTEEAAKKHETMVLMGTRPDKPGPKFGHIKKGEALGDIASLFRLDMFKEKPDFATAKAYWESGQYLWNSGSFVASYKTIRRMVDALDDKSWGKQLSEIESAINEDARAEAYLKFERQAIDIALIEQSEGVLVIEQQFKWMDLGSFDDIYKISDKDEQGNAVEVKRYRVVESSNNLVKSTVANKPVALVGVDDLIIVDTPNGLLIAHQNRAQEVKKIAEELDS